ncbi:peptide deformylase [Pseudobacillus wudalianchiensis]|uniref:Peptide deformylase n=1 Tax=Pseudobacillus wudalianchiensis TaxID=1743143 RepID=A0A1B9AT28_9BACI|nr:peptide deformylase [Bacillus wudalianchiensis]OCA87040.1 peptide deformylase [Bacillus wudalianchiensis]
MITMKDIVREGHPALREKAVNVALPPSEEDKKTAKQLLEYVQNSQDPETAKKFGLRPGVGLAAPQIGLTKRIIAIQVHDEQGKLISHALINPKIVSHSVEKAYLLSGEGCLSVDRDVPGYVHRYARVTIKAIDLEGKEIKLRLKGMPAIVAQHEIDHLNGIMFYDHIDPKNPFSVVEGSVPIER